MTESMMFTDVHLKAIGDVLRASSIDNRNRLPPETRDALAGLWLDAHKKTNDMNNAARRLITKDPNSALQVSDEAWYIYGQLRLSIERQKGAFVLLHKILHSLDNNFYGKDARFEEDTLAEQSLTNEVILKVEQQQQQHICDLPISHRPNHNCKRTFRPHTEPPGFSLKSQTRASKCQKNPCQ